MQLYREWTLKPEHRRGSMMPLGHFVAILKGPNPGYSSVYMFDENAAKAVIETHSSAGLARFPVYAEELVMDLDNGEDQLKLAQAKLDALGLAYDVWFSGSKGYHIVIPHDRMYSGPHIPYSQRVWVEALGVGADLSLYQHGRILSLPGRVHAKTGKRKELVSRHKGQTLALQLKEPAGPVFSLRNDGGISELEAGLWKCLQSLGEEPAPGNRHTRLWSTALHLADAGVSYEATLELMNRINESWLSPKGPEEVELAVSQAYRRSPGPRTT